MDAGTVPLSAVPILLQILDKPGHLNRDEVLALLCDLVSGAYGAEGDALGKTIREAGGLKPIASLLSETDSSVQKHALYLLGNLCSDAVDPRSALSKQALLTCEAEAQLLQCLESADEEVVTYACAALQNLCHDPDWAYTMLELGAVAALEDLLANSNKLVTHYATGALKNLIAAATRVKLVDTEDSDEATDGIAMPIVRCASKPVEAPSTFYLFPRSAHTPHALHIPHAGRRLCGAYACLETVPHSLRQLSGGTC